MPATAIVPVKRFAAAKQRLSGSTEPEHRRRLAAAMLSDVLAALGRCEAVGRVIVVSGEPLAAEAAQAAGFELLGDDDAGHSEAASRGIEAAVAAGDPLAALLPGDCPLLDPSELDRALGSVPADSVGVVPDRHGSGTNALLLRPPDAIAPSFGPGSCERHLRLAAAAGMFGRVVPMSSLALDLDTGGDLKLLAGRLAAEPERAPATASALASNAIAGGRA